MRPEDGVCISASEGRPGEAPLHSWQRGKGRALLAGKAGPAKARGHRTAGHSSLNVGCFLSRDRDREPYVAN